MAEETRRRQKKAALEKCSPIDCLDGRASMAIREGYVPVAGLIREFTVFRHKTPELNYA